jgi:hypothetical protein
MAWEPSLTPEERRRRWRAHWRARFPMGSRVRLLTERVAHLPVDLPSERGVVVGYGRDPEIIRVRLDGETEARGWHVSFLEVEALPPGTAPTNG